MFPDRNILSERMFLSGNIEKFPVPVRQERMFLSGNIERMFLSGNIGMSLSYVPGEHRECSCRGTPRENVPVGEHRENVPVGEH